MSRAQPPRIALLRCQLQAYLIFVASIQLLRPDHAELDAALPKKNYQCIQRFQLVMNRAQPRAGGREVQRVGQRFKYRAGSVFSSYPHGQHTLPTLLLPPVYLHLGLHLWLRNSVPQTKAGWNGPDVGGTMVTGQSLGTAGLGVRAMCETRLAVVLEQSCSMLSGEARIVGAL